MTPAPPLRLRTQSIMQTVCKLPLTVAISCSRVPFLSMGCVVGLGAPQCLHVPVQEHAWGDHRGAQVAPKPCSSHTNPQQSLPHAVLPHQHRGCVQRGASLTPATGEPTAAAGWGTSPRVASVPKQGVGSVFQPHAPSFLVLAGGPGPTPACSPELRQPGPEVAGQGGRGVADTHGLGRVLQTKLVRLPAARTRSQIPLPPVLFQYEHARPRV